MNLQYSCPLERDKVSKLKVLESNMSIPARVTFYSPNVRYVLDNIIINGCEKFAFRPLKAEKHDDSFQIR